MALPPSATPLIRRIRPGELAAAETEAIDAIFFATSNTKTFADDETRRQFRERWLGRYLAHSSDVCFIATSAGQVVGYLVATLDNAAVSPRFADIAYFQAFARECGRFPAHLHINLAADWRNRGVGQRLIEAFAEVARAAGSPGMHVVTSEGARNVAFYAKCGFTLQAVEAAAGGRRVFLGRQLTARRPDPGTI